MHGDFLMTGCSGCQAGEAWVPCTAGTESGCFVWKLLAGRDLHEIPQGGASYSWSRPSWLRRTRSLYSQFGAFQAVGSSALCSLPKCR